MNLTWNPSTDTGGSGLAGYEIFRDSTYLNTSSVASYADQAGTPATTYAYTVRAYDLAVPANRSAFSNAVSVTTLDTVPPVAPGNPSFSAITGNSATATWTAATDNVGVTGYQYSLNSGASWTPLSNVLSTGLAGLSASTPYTMLLQARDAAGNWSSSSSASFTTLSGWIPITDSNGNVLSSASALYQQNYYCDFSLGFPACFIEISKKYGNFAVVWMWVLPLDWTCAQNQGGNESGGYRDLPWSCSLEATSAAYGQ